MTIDVPNNNKLIFELLIIFVFLISEYLNKKYFLQNKIFFFQLFIKIFFVIIIII